MDKVRDTHYDVIDIMLPTYKRTNDLLPKFLKSIYDTAENLSNLRLTLCVNRSDAETLEFVDRYDFGGLKHETIIEDTRQPNLAKYFNLMEERSIWRSNNVVITMFGDDMLFLTNGWDKIIIDRINAKQGVGVFYCNDNYIAKQSLCVNLFVTRPFVDATQAPFMCDIYHADMIDLVWYYVGYYTSTLHYCEDIEIQHNHNTKRPEMEWDGTFRRLRPVQELANKKENQSKCQRYAGQIARNLILAGYGKRIFEEE